MEGTHAVGRWPLMPRKPLTAGPHSLRSTNKTTNSGKTERAHSTRSTAARAERHKRQGRSLAPVHAGAQGEARTPIWLRQFGGLQGEAQCNAAGDCARVFPHEASERAQQRSCEGVMGLSPAWARTARPGRSAAEIELDGQRTDACVSKSMRHGLWLGVHELAQERGILCPRK